MAGWSKNCRKPCSFVKLSRFCVNFSNLYGVLSLNQLDLICVNMFTFRNSGYIFHEWFQYIFFFQEKTVGNDVEEASPCTFDREILSQDWKEALR